jgi:hypothetical protein
MQGFPRNFSIAGRAGGPGPGGPAGQLPSKLPVIERYAPSSPRAQGTVNAGRNSIKCIMLHEVAAAGALGLKQSCKANGARKAKCKRSKKSEVPKV